MKIRQVWGISLILVGVGLLVGAGAVWSRPTDPVRPTPLWQAEPLIPTAKPAGSVVAISAPASPAPGRDFQPDRFIPRPQANPSTELARFGVGVPHPPLEAKVVEQLGLGWYLVWGVLEAPPRPAGIEFWQMVRLHEAGYRPDKATIRQVAQANRGATWLIGNEPDVIWQDNVTPARYAKLYHELYYFLKGTDPTCRVAIGGVAQPTPLRLQYLEAVLAAYQAAYQQPMPVDVWNIHNFILREARDSWGVGIPPSLKVDQGSLYELDDHDNLEIFKAQIINFRRWLAARGQRDKPLIVSEYGLLMPVDYGFGSERTQRFLDGTYEFMLKATDERLGYPADGNRLVQRWAWYSLSDNRYPTGNFIDFETGELTKVGQAHQEYITKLP